MRIFKVSQFARLTLASLFLLGSSLSLAVDTPLNLRGTEVRQNTVKWEWAPVNGASQYEVIVDNVSQGPTRDTKFFSYDLSVGQHVMYVRALDANGEASAPTQQIQISVSSAFQSGSGNVSSTQSGSSLSGSDRNSSNIATPSNPRGSQTSPRTVTWAWDAVTGASAYEVTVDGLVAGQTNNTSYQSANLWVGEHSMTVKAVNSSGQRSQQSDTVKLIVTGGSDTGGSTSASSGSVVQGLRATELANRSVRWQWNDTLGASSYEVTVDGNVAGTTTNTQWVSENLWVGEHSLTVKSINSSGARSQQSDTLKMRVTGNTSSNAETVAAAPPEPSVAEATSGNPSASDAASLIDTNTFAHSDASKDGYELVFSDEFSGTSLNPTRWHSQLRWDGEWNGERYEYRLINGESQFYVNVLSEDPEHQQDIVPVYNPFKFNGSTLKIQAARNPLYTGNGSRTFGRLDDIVVQQPFLSGAISTHEKFFQKHGYFEARIKIPGNTGTFPAFWLFHARRAYEGTQRTEIDIMENLGHAPYYIYNSFHYFDNVTATYSGDANFIRPSPSGQVGRPSGTDYSQDFHTYAVEWTEGRIIWFIDGVQVSELREGQASYEELYVMLNLAIGGNWTNFPTTAGGLGRPSGQRYPTAQDINEFQNPALEIDYVRVYKRR